MSYIIGETLNEQQKAQIARDGNSGWNTFYDAYQAATLSGDQSAAFVVYGGNYNTAISNLSAISISDSGSLTVVGDDFAGGYKANSFTLTNLNFVNDGTVAIMRAYDDKAETDVAVTFKLVSTTTDKLTFTNNNSLTIQNATFIADQVVNAADAQIILKKATFTVGDVENAGLIRITGGEFNANLTGGGTVWLATAFEDTEITGDNDFIVKYATSLEDSSITGDSLSVELGNLTLSGSTVTFADVTIASGKFLFVDGEGNTINFGSVTGTVSVKAGAVLSDSTVGAGTVYFGKNTALVGANAFAIIQVSGDSKDATSDAYRKLTIGNNVAPTVDEQTGKVTFATTLSATKIQLGSATKYGNLDIQNAKINVATLNSANADNVVNVIGKNDLTIGNLTGSINLANGADVTATVTDAAEGAAFNVGYTTTDTFDPASGKPTPVANAWVTVTETVQSFADVATLAGVAEDVDVNVAGGTLNVLGTAVVADVATSVAPTTTTVTGTTYHYDNKKKEIVADRIEKTTTKAKNLTGTVNVGTSDGTAAASLVAGEITNGGIFNVYGSAGLFADAITNSSAFNVYGSASAGTITNSSAFNVSGSASAGTITNGGTFKVNSKASLTATTVTNDGTLTLSKGGIVDVDTITGNADSQTGTVSIAFASDSATIGTIENQKSVSISSGAKLVSAAAISDNTAVTITAATVDVDELKNNGTVTIGKGKSTLTVDDFAGTITMASGAVLNDSLIGVANALSEDESIAESDNVIKVGYATGSKVKSAVEEVVDPKKQITVQTYNPTIASFSGENFAAADLLIDGGTANVSGQLMVDDVVVSTTSGDIYGKNVTFKEGTGDDAGKAVVDDPAYLVGTLNIAAASAGAEDPAVVVADAVTNAGTINVGTSTLAGKLYVVGTDDGEALTNNGTVNVSGNLNAVTINNGTAGKAAEGEQGEAGYTEAVDPIEGFITVGGIVAEEPLTYSTSALFADSITNYAGTISVKIGSYIDADTITNYATITVDSLGADNASSETAGRLYANSILNKEGATLNLAGVLGSIAGEDAQLLTITAEVGSTVNFARWTTAENVKIVGGGTINLGNQFHYNTLVLSGASLTSSGNFYTVGEDTSITIDAASSIKTNSFGADDTIIFDATNIDSIKDIKWTLVDADVRAVTLKVKLAEGAELVPVTDNLQINDDYTIVKRADKITLTKQTQKTVYIKQAWEGYADGTSVEIDAEGNTATIGFNAFDTFNKLVSEKVADWTADAETPVVPGPKVNTSAIEFQKGEGDPDPVFSDTEKKNVLYSNKDVTFSGAEGVDNITIKYKRLYLMKAVDLKELTSDNYAEKVLAAAEDAPTFTIAQGFTLAYEGEALKIGDTLDNTLVSDETYQKHGDPVPGNFAVDDEGNEGKALRVPGVGKLDVNGELDVKGALNLENCAVMTIDNFWEETIEPVELGDEPVTVQHISKATIDGVVHVRPYATLTVDGKDYNFDAEGAEAYQFKANQIAFINGGAVTLKNTKAELNSISISDWDSPIDPEATAENPYQIQFALDKSTLTIPGISNDGLGNTGLFGYYGSYPKAVGENHTLLFDMKNGSVVTTGEGGTFNTLKEVTVKTSGSTINSYALTNNGTINAENKSVIANIGYGGDFTNNNVFTLNDSSLTLAWSYFKNWGTFEATNKAEITASVSNFGSFTVDGATMNGEGWEDYTLRQFTNWAWDNGPDDIVSGTVLVKDSVVSIGDLVNQEGASFTVTGESSLSVANTFTGTVELVDATLTDSVIVAGGLLNIAANLPIPAENPDAEPVANEVTFAGGNVIAATIDNAGTANFTTTGDAVNAIATFNNAEDATLAISGNLTKAGENEASIKNDGTASATGATIDYVMLNNNGEFTLSGTSLTSNSSSAVWNKGTFEASAKSTLNAAIKNQGVGAVTIDDSTVTTLIDNDSANGTVTVKNGSKIASATNKGTFSMTASDAVGDISNSKTFTADGGSITGNIENVANATFTMKNGTKFIGHTENPNTNYTITNAGTFNLENAKITDLKKVNNTYYGAVINNTGTFNVSGSDFEVSAVSITTDAGDKFKVKGTGKLDVRELSGRIRIDDNTTLNTAKIADGTIANKTAGELYVGSSKTLTLTADSEFKNTKITNKGTITAQKLLSTKKDDNNIGALDNQGTVTVSGAMTVGAVTNASGKSITATGDMTTGAITNNGGTIEAKAKLTASAITTNTGTIKTTGNGLMKINGAVSNNGTVTASAGLEASGAITNEAGKKIEVTGNLTAKSTIENKVNGNNKGSITATGDVAVDGLFTNAGTFKGSKSVNVKAGLTNSGSFTVGTELKSTNAGKITNSAGTMEVGSMNLKKDDNNYGEVENNASLKVNGDMTVGKVTNNAGKTIEVSGALTTYKAGGSYQLFTNNGTLKATGSGKNVQLRGGLTNSGTVEIAGNLDSYGKDITNNANATITVKGDLTTKKDNNTIGAVTNSGTFKVDGNVTTGAFTSDGGNFTIKAKADKTATMTVNGNFSNTGTLTIDVTALKDQIAVGDQVLVVSVTGNVVTSVGNIALTGTDSASFKKIIQTTGDQKGIYLYKTDQVVSAPTIYVNGAWAGTQAGAQIEFPEGSGENYTFGLDAFAGTNTLDLASDTKELKIVYSGGYDALNISQSLDVTIWNSTGTSPAAETQTFTGLSVSGDKTVANLRGQKITTTGTTTVGTGTTLDLRSNDIMDHDPATLHTGAVADLGTMAGAGTIMTDWNSTLTIAHGLIADGALDIDVTGYAGGDATIIKGYGQENHYKAAVGAEKYNKYFTVSGNDLKMNTSAREVIYVNSASAYDIESAIEYTWLGADQTTEYHADTIAILGGNYAEVLSFEGIDGQKIIVDGGVFTKSVYGGNIVEGTGTGRVVADVTGDINIEVNGGSFKNLVAGDNIKTKAIYSRTGDINLSISGTASFTSVVAAGMMCQLDAGGSLIELVGDTNLTISGGSFAKTVFGGMFATKLNSSGNTYLDGTANVTVVGGDDKITFGDGLCVGSYGYGGISKGTALTLTGNAEMIKFTGTGTDIWGGCSGDYYTTSDKYESSMDTGAKRTLTFSGFEGNFAGCDSINGFSDVFVQDGTSVELASGINLKHVDNWTFECGSTLAGTFTNDLTKDTLTLTDYTNLEKGKSWTLFGADVDLQGVNAQMNVYFGATKVDYNTTAQGWVSGEYTLKYTDDTGLVMSRAVLA